MRFNKRAFCANLSFILFVGLLAMQPGKQALGQAAQYNCRANATGDGWDCESSAGATEISPRTSSDRFRGSDDNPFAGDPQTTPLSSSRPSSVQENRPPTTDAVRAGTAPLLGTPADLDWVEREQLTPEQLALIPRSCCGAFIEPERVEVISSLTTSTSDTLFQTTDGVRRSADDTLSVSGPVSMQQGDRSVRNNGESTISGEDGSVVMSGNIEMREPGVLIRGNAANIDNKTGNSRIDNAQYVLHENGIHGSAESVVYTSDTGFLTIINGEFSRCEPDTNFWRLSANSIVIDQQLGRGYAEGATLRIKDVPVFYYPFTLAFPLGDERISGFLAPSLGSTRDGGTDFELPYYFNLAPNLDATLSPRLVSDRGVMINAETRYLASWSMNTINVSHLGGDKKYSESAAGTPLPGSPETKDRWFFGYEHSGALGRNWSSFVDYEAVSDADFFRDLGSSGLNIASRTHMNRQGRIDFRSDLVQAGLNVQRIHIIDPFFDSLSGNVDLNKPYDRLPQFTLESDLPLFGNLRFGLVGEFTAFDRNLSETLLTPDQLENGALVSGNRVNLEPEVTWAIEAPGWFLRPSAKYKHISYDLRDQAVTTAKNPDVGVGIFSVDTGLIFERSMDFGNGGYTQTLEPRLYYLNSDYEDQSMLPVFDSSEYGFSFNQMFRDERFGGGDRIGDANQLTTALTSRILDPQGRERARVGLGQITYFEDRLVGLGNPLQTWTPHYALDSSSSAIIGEFSYSVSDNWRINSDFQWDQEQQELDEGSFQFHYQSDNNLIINAAYRYRDVFTLPGFILPPEVDTRIKQTDLSSVWPVNGNWSILGRWNYDHSNSRNLESFAGVEFSNCCTTIRLIAREWVRQDELFQSDSQPNRGVFLQFTLNGLGNITGGGLSNLLSDSIMGFKGPNQL